MPTTLVTWQIRGARDVDLAVCSRGVGFAGLLACLRIASIIFGCAYVYQLVCVC